MENKYIISYKKRYENFKYTLKQCGTFLIKASDKEMETSIFEDFDIGVRSDLCDENLELFIDEGWIDEEIKKRCLKLKQLFIQIESCYPELWNIQSVRSSNTWIEILELSDAINRQLYC